MGPDIPEDFVLTAEEEEAFKQWRGKKDLSEKLIWRAAEEEKAAFVKYLALQGYGAESLLKAAHKGKEKIVKSLVEAGVIVDALDNKGRTPLIKASMKGHVNVIEFLIEADANIDHKDSKGYGRTALIYAVQQGSTAVVNVLVQHGADLSLHGGNIGDKTPLKWAITREFWSIYSILEEYEKKREFDRGANEAHAMLLEAEKQEQKSNEWEIIEESGQELIVHRSGNNQSRTGVKDIFDFNARRLFTIVTSEGITYPPVEKPFSEVNPACLKQAEEKRGFSQPQLHP